MKRLRLLDVTVAARFITDDGEVIEEVTTEPVRVTASGWADYPATFEASRAALEAQLNEEPQP